MYKTIVWMCVWSVWPGDGFDGRCVVFSGSCVDVRPLWPGDGFDGKCVVFSGSCVDVRLFSLARRLVWRKVGSIFR